MRRYGQIAIAILEEIADFGTRGAALAEAMLTVGVTKFIYPSLEKRFNEIMKKNEAAKERSRERRRFYQTLCRLKKEGIVARNGSDVLVLTERGRNILEEEKRRSPRMSFPSKTYPIKTIQEITVIIFDIPEVQRERREWFRAVITKLGFSMAQKSVWIGAVDIPEQLINDLRSLLLLPYVKFFTVVARGTLREDSF
jgi:DNA-binding transcriptional regulator PaaX